MDEQRQHLEHEVIPLMSQPNLQDLCDATVLIDEKWIEDTMMDKLNVGELKKLLPVINSLVIPYKVFAPLRTDRSSLANLSWKAPTSPAMPHISIQTAKKHRPDWP